MGARPIGSAIGAVAGVAFVVINAGAIPASLIWRIAAVIGAVAIVWFVVLRGPRIELETPSRAALRTYGLSVAAMAVAIPAGAAVISNLFDRPDAVLPWVVFVVGVHFWPFARAFALPIFGWLSVSLVTVSVVGVVATVVSDGSTAQGWTGVTAGFVLLIFSAAGPRLTSTPRNT